MGVASSAHNANVWSRFPVTLDQNKFIAATSCTSHVQQCHIRPKAAISTPGAGILRLPNNPIQL